jgi:hypothetical protein
MVFLASCPGAGCAESCQLFSGPGILVPIEISVSPKICQFLGDI